jgi:hypothetical protein
MINSSFDTIIMDEPDDCQGYSYTYINDNCKHKLIEHVDEQETTYLRNRKRSRTPSKFDPDDPKYKKTWKLWFLRVYNRIIHAFCCCMPGSGNDEWAP